MLTQVALTWHECANNGSAIETYVVEAAEAVAPVAGPAGAHFFYSLYWYKNTNPDGQSMRGLWPTGGFEAGTKVQILTCRAGTKVQILTCSACGACGP